MNNFNRPLYDLYGDQDSQDELPDDNIFNNFFPDATTKNVATSRLTS